MDREIETLLNHVDEAVGEAQLQPHARVALREGAERRAQVHRPEGTRRRYPQPALWLGVRQDFRVLTALAIGYPGRHPDLPDDVFARDARPRERRPVKGFVFGERWEEGEFAG